MIAPLVCPNCHVGDRLATLEKIEALADGGAGVRFTPAAGFGRTARVDERRVFDHDGLTDVLYDTSESIGIYCRNCDWQSQASDVNEALDELEVEDDEEYAA